MKQTQTANIGVSRHQLARWDRDAFRERVPQNPVEWMPWHVRFPSTWEATAFDFDQAPHVRGLLELFWNDPTKRKASLCWATRLCKTSTVLGLMEWAAENKPAPMACLFPDKGILEAALFEHIYPMLEQTAVIRRQLLPEHKRNKKSIVLRDCRIRLANAGSKSDASGYPALYIFKIEHDKCPTSKSSEADSSRRIESRCSAYSRGAKILEESTPGDAETSRVAKLLKDPNVQQVRYQVPCPHCRQYQELEFRQVQYDRDELGDQIPSLALQTARYVCPHCNGVMENHHRPQLMRSGKWVIEGQSVTVDGVVTGEPKVNSDTMVFGPLSKLYSLFISGWGAVAQEFVEALLAMRRGDFEPMRKFKTETLAEPWVQTPIEIPANELAEHLRGEHLRGICPKQTAFVTTTADVGRVGDTNLFHWQVMAWWSLEVQQHDRILYVPQGAVVDWGTVFGDVEWLKFLERQYPVAELPGSRVPLADFPIGIDSGKYSDEVYALCDLIDSAIPLKGDSRTGQNIVVDWYYWGFRRTGQDPRVTAMKKKLDVGDLLMVNSHKTQKYRESIVCKRRRPGQDGFVYLPVDVCDSWEQFDSYFQQLVADVEQNGKWIRTGPNEAGDGLRYGRVMAEKYTIGGTRWPHVRLPFGCTGQPVLAKSQAVPVVEQISSQFSGGYLLSQR